MTFRISPLTRQPWMLILLLAFVLPVMSSCEDDDPIDASPNELRLDGPNLTGPILDAGTHRFGVRFSQTELQPFDGRELTGIRIFIGSSMRSLYMSANQGGDRVPGMELEAVQAATPIPGSPAFYDYEFVRPVIIDASQPLWLMAEVELERSQQSIGCDAGPAVPGGDWLWSGDRWLDYRERTGGRESVNWNIRGILR